MRTSPDRKRTGSRRGVALLIVMVAVSTSLVLVLAFTRSQAVSLQIDANTNRRERALHAAWTGAALALEAIQDPAWAGVEQAIQHDLGQDDDGRSSCHVVFRPVEPDGDEPFPDDAALRMRIVSTGRWTARADSARTIERVVEVVVRLQPRLPGRTAGPHDDPAAVDVAPNPGGYDRIRRYAIFARGGSTSLVLDPGDRVDGPLWLDDDLRLYGDPYWSASIRRQYVESVGAAYGSGGRLLHPHPFGRAGLGDADPVLTFRHEPAGRVQDDLARLNVSWTTTDGEPAWPGIDFSDWRRYRLYEGGFEYEAEEVGSYLSDAELRPTPENPLGIFYRSGSVTLGDDVTIQGTLVATDQVDVRGEFVHLAGYDGTDQSGRPLAGDRSAWPRLPAIVAEDVHVDRSIRVSIDGAVLVRDSFRGAGGDFEYRWAADVDVRGTASAEPARQPFSTVRLEGSPNLGNVSSDARHAVWLADGDSGTWHAIVEVDADARRLTVVGEVTRPASTPFRIARNRRRYCDVRGPIAGWTHDVNRPNSWAVPDGWAWQYLENAWRDENEDREDEDRPPIPFVHWLADGDNFSHAWPHPIDDYGLRLQPTFYVRNDGRVPHQWSAPLFRPYEDDLPDSEHAGYRWTVLSWRERR